jgi:acetolactate synthase I/II/III large subunit
VAHTYHAVLVSNAVTIGPKRPCAELTRHLPDNAIVVVGTGHAGMWMGVRPHRSASELHAQRWPPRLGLPGRARRQMRLPRPAGGDDGDGVDPPAHRDNNGGRNRSKVGFERVYGGTQTEGGRAPWTFNKTNLARIAEDIGALGIRVENADAFPPALARALAAERPGGHRRGEETSMRWRRSQ